MSVSIFYRYQIVLRCLKMHERTRKRRLLLLSIEIVFVLLRVWAFVGTGGRAPLQAFWTLRDSGAHHLTRASLGASYPSPFPVAVTPQPSCGQSWLSMRDEPCAGS